MTEGPFFVEPTITDRMRMHLQPKGTAPVVGLHLNDRFFHADFIHKCIDELEKMPFRDALGQPPTDLEKLAYILLCDSAYIKTKDKE
jgi:hypothetical protein